MGDRYDTKSSLVYKRTVGFKLFPGQWNKLRLPDWKAKIFFANIVEKTQGFSFV